MNDVATREQTIPQRPQSEEDANKTQIAAYIKAIEKRSLPHTGEKDPHTDTDVEKTRAYFAELKLEIPMQEGETQSQWLYRIIMDQMSEEA